MSFSEIGTSGATSPLLRSSDGRSSKPIRVRIRSPSDRPLLRLVPVSPSCIVSPRLDQLVQRGLGWIFWANAFNRIDWPLRRRSDFLSQRSSTNIDGNRRESTSSSGVRWIGLIPAAGPGLRLCPGTSSAPQTSGVTHTRLKYLTPRRTKKPRLPRLPTSCIMGMEHGTQCQVTRVIGCTGVNEYENICTLEIESSSLEEQVGIRP